MIRGGEWLQEGSEFDAEMPGNRGSGVFGNGTRVVWYIRCLGSSLGGRRRAGRLSDEIRNARTAMSAPANVSKGTQFALVRRTMGDVGLRFEYSVEADVTPAFAWQFRTDVSNWNDPPAEF